MLFALYDLPHSLMGPLICGTWLLIGVGGYLAFHRVCRTVFAEGEKNLAVALLAVIATVNSLLLAFSAISAWEAFGSAEKAVRGEAVTIGALARNLAVFDTTESHAARDLLGGYTRIVLDEEWQAMRRGQKSDATWTAFEKVFTNIGQLHPSAPHHATLMPEIWVLTNELLKYRRERLYESEAGVPSALWIVVVVGSLLTIATTYVFPRTAFNTIAVGMLSLSLGLVFFFIVAMDRPFCGTEGIRPAPIEATLVKMEHWNEVMRKSAAVTPTPAGK